MACPALTLVGAPIFSLGTIYHSTFSSIRQRRGRASLSLPRSPEAVWFKSRSHLLLVEQSAIAFLGFGRGQAIPTECEENQAPDHPIQTLAALAAGRLTSNPDEPEPPFLRAANSLNRLTTDRVLSTPDLLISIES